MGWNDHYCPSSYDPACPDSMRALADRAVRDAPTRGEDTGTCYKCEGAADIAGYRIRALDGIIRGACRTCLPGECWECGDACEHNQCNRCWRANNY